MKSKIFLPSIFAVALAGCTLAPKYQRPEAPIGNAWPNGTVQTNGTPPAEMSWSEFFDDPQLQALIDASLKNNRDLRVAALRVEQLRAQYRIERAALFPSVDAGATVLRQRTPRTVSITGSAVNTTAYDVSVGAAYELDLFGRIRSLKDEALETYFAADETRNSARIALISEVALQYLTILQIQEAREIARQTLEAVQSSYKLNKASLEAGVASELDLRTAEAQVQTTLVNLSNYDQLLAQARNALVLLVGEPLTAELPKGRPLMDQTLLRDLPAGLPSDLLQRRPDILAAEHILKAANANIGAARAAFFPRILLTGSAGTASARLGDLFTGPSAAWSFSPQISVPIFEGGRNRANLDVSKIGEQIEVANYERAIQIAFREVADALAARESLKSRVEAQRLLVEAQQKRFDLTNARYRQGVDNYVDVLLAQQDLYAAQQNLLQFRAAQLMNSVTLFRSLGGGWPQPGPDYADARQQ
jgi:multidrug efflux system outer membrane protein